MPGCRLLTGHLFCPVWSDLWIRLWISFDRKVEGWLPPRQVTGIVTQQLNNQPSDPTGHRSPANCHDLTRPAPLLSARQTPSILPSYRKPLPGNLLQFRYQTVTKARQRFPPEWGSLTHLFLLSLDPAEPEQSAKGLQMTTDKEIAKSIREWQFNECEGCSQPLRDCVCESFDYEGTIRFTTDKQLTNEQLAQLIDLITLQIVEPVDENQEDEDYSTRNAEVTIKEVN